MEQVRNVSLEAALECLRDANQMFVRLALSQDDTGARVLRNLMVDVLPQRWLTNHDQQLLAPWLKDQRVFECQSTLVFCGLLPADRVRDWFKRPDDCRLTGFDDRPGYAARQVSFALPEMHGTVAKWHLPSYALNAAKTIPYPSYLYTLTPKQPSQTQTYDDDPLIGEDGDYYPSFRAARAELIFGVTDRNEAYQRSDAFVVRVVDARGWLHELRVTPDNVVVTVAGLDIIGKSVVVLLGGGAQLDRQSVSHNQVSLKLPSHIPDLVEVHLVGGGSVPAVLDEAFFASATHPLPSKSPQVIVEREDVFSHATLAHEDAPAYAPTEVLAAEKDGEPHPKVFLSYSNDSFEHTGMVREFVARLRREGIDCQLDKYERNPLRGWPNWMSDQIAWADYVLVVCTETYCRRFSGQEVAGKGLGATWEGKIITQALYDQAGKNDKFIPIVFSPNDIAHIPLPLENTNYYLVSNSSQYEKLYARLTDQMFEAPPPLGQVRPVRREAEEE